MNNKKYVVFDIETTGFSPNLHRITEIGAVKIEAGIITEEFHRLIDPEVPVPWRITEITGITDELLAGQPTIEDILPLFLEFCSDCALVAHNARFDMGFIKSNAAIQGLECNCEVVDTLSLARRIFPKLENHQLNTVANHIDVEHLDHHRAMGDARTTAHIFLRCCELLG
ncbi:MAG: exonuclease domain-containing protein [Oscillospiraceae bacterium]|nr:exonuclease domain-containing protein [Oscillospiraceae bacterium]